MQLELDLCALHMSRCHCICMVLGVIGVPLTSVLVNMCCSLVKQALHRLQLLAPWMVHVVCAA
jgi:hypothetical protein